MSDTINCFDQLNESSKVRIKKSGLSNNMPKKLKLGLNSKVRFFNFIMPPFIAISSLITFSFCLIYFYNPVEIEEKKELINPK